jgi:hypothetical protein
MQNVSIHTHRLAVYLRDSFTQLKHPNGKEVVEIYSASGETFTDCRKQGGIVTFNLKTASGDYVCTTYTSGPDVFAIRQPANVICA